MSWTKLSLLLCSLLASCGSTAWSRYPHSLYGAMKTGTPEAVVAHHQLLASVVKEHEAAGKKPPAGIAAELAYYSHVVGKQAMVQPSLALERRHYPQSEKFLALLERFLPSVPVLDPNDGKQNQKEVQRNDS